MQKLLNKALEFIGSKLFFYLTLTWFTLQALVIALSTSVGIPPDERWHIALIKLYARDGLDPFINNQSGYFFLGPVSRNVSFLYHYLSSMIYRLVDAVGLEANSVSILRFFNIALGVATLYVIWKVLKKLKINNLATNLVVFMMASTLMFVFLSASINYDNLLFLLTAAMIYYLVSLFNNLSTKNTFGFLAVTLLALLTKSTFLPIAIMALISVVILHRKNLQTLVDNIVKSWNIEKFSVLAMLFIIIALTSIVTERYVGNIVKYKSINPGCSEILTIEQCQQSPIYVRDVELSKVKPEPKEVMPIDLFTFNWLLAMKDRTYGIFSHKIFSPNRYVSLGMYAIFTVFLIAIIRKFNTKEKILNVLLRIAVAYYGILLIVNRSSYVGSGMFGVALQGRYGISVIFILYAAGLHYSSKLFGQSNALKLIFASFIIIIFAASSLPSYVFKSDSTWYTQTGLNLKGAIE